VSTTAEGDVVLWSLLFVAREVLAGFVLGLLCLLAVEAAFMAGHLVDQAIVRGVPWEGAGAAPGGPHAPLLGGLTVTIFLVLGGHRRLLASLAESYRLLPLDRWPLLPEGASSGVVGALSVMVAQAMALVWQLAAPVLVASAMAEVIIAAIAGATASANIGQGFRGGAVPLVVLLVSILGMAQESVRFLMEIPRFFHRIATIVIGWP
jgi:type III secretory pathway component EscT